jgi:hypothetical protein
MAGCMATDTRVNMPIRTDTFLSYFGIQKYYCAASGIFCSVHMDTHSEPGQRSGYLVTIPATLGDLRPKNRS